MSGVKTRPITMISVCVVGPSATSEHERDDHDRQRQHGLDDAARDGVRPAAEVPHGEAERGAEHGAEKRRQRRDDQDAAGADDDAREHVAAELVGAEPVPGDRTVVDRQQVLPERVVGGEHIPEERAQHPERAIAAPIRNVFDCTSWRSSSPRTCPVPAGTAPGSTTGRRGAHSSPPRRMRGFSIDEAMSARSVATMYTIPIVSTPASSIGKSLSLAALKISWPMPW